MATSKQTTQGLVVFTAADLAVLQEASLEVQALSKKVYMPPFMFFVGEETVELTVHTKRYLFVTVNAEGVKDEIPFKSKRGNELISYLMLILPMYAPEFREDERFIALEDAGLTNRLLERQRVVTKNKRPAFLVGAMKVTDIQVINEDIVQKHLVDYSIEELLEQVVEEVSPGNYQLYPGVYFAMGKDTNPENLLGPNTFFQKLRSSLNMHMYARQTKKQPQMIEVVQRFAKDGKVLNLKDPRKFYLADELLNLDGKGLSFGEVDDFLLEEIFTSFTVFHDPKGELEVGSVVKKEEGRTYKSYMRTMSQARSAGSFAFESMEAVIAYFLGTGQDEVAYAEPELDENGNPTGYKVMNVAKSSTRQMLGMSNGNNPDQGILTRFRGRVDVQVTKFQNGEFHADIYTVTNKHNEVFKFAVGDDFTSIVPKENRFLVNKLDKDAALQRELIEFDAWEHPSAAKILTRNLTDGSGVISTRFYKQLRKAGVVHSKDAFQLRILNAIKGAVYAFDPITDHLGVDLFITDGMVKSKNFLKMLKTKGLEVFVVGQRKETSSGSWIPSQALQQMGLTLEEMQNLTLQTLDYGFRSMKERCGELLMNFLDGTETATESEFTVHEFLRLAQASEAILDEQYIQDQKKGLIVKKLNQLLDCRFFVEDAQSRYMFVDPFAIYNAMINGRYMVTKEDAVLGRFEIICPDKKGNQYYMRKGKAISNRMPVTVTHELALVLAVAKEEYAEGIKQGLWQGIVFYDIETWVVAMQAGADHDGDSAVIIFDPIMVAARERIGKRLFGNLPVLPLLDAYVQYDDDGNIMDIGTGAATYVAPAKEGTVVAEEVKPDRRVVDGFVIEDQTIAYHEDHFKGPKRQEKREQFLRLVAEMTHKKLVSSIEVSDVGLIANRAMNTTDLLSRNVLTPEERVQVEQDLMLLTTVGRWEIDRAKHGGAFLLMPEVIKLYSHFEAYYFSKEEMSLTDDQKKAIVQKVKGVYFHIFEPVTTPDGLVGFRVIKPQWLASQKDEFGVVREDSLFQQSLSFARERLTMFCTDLTAEHSNTAKHNIRGLVVSNMSLDLQHLEAVKGQVEGHYLVFKAKEQARIDELNAFKKDVLADLKERGVIRRKLLKSLTKAKKDAIIRKYQSERLREFSVRRDLLAAEFRKEMYNLAESCGLDIRTLVGALYLVINGVKNNGSAAWREDGREIRFVPSNGYIAIPFEVFADEMASLVSGPVSETYFITTDLLFMHVGVSNEVEVKVRLMDALPQYDEEIIGLEKEIEVLVREEEHESGVRKVAYFKKKDVKLDDLSQLTREQSAFVGFAPAGLRVGPQSVYVRNMHVTGEGKYAVVTIEMR